MRPGNMLPNLHVNEFKRSRPAGGRVSAQEAPIRLEAINILHVFHQRSYVFQNMFFNVFHIF